jgi:C4-dicarboxylate-specific signal transduction histidine kinase
LGKVIDDTLKLLSYDLEGKVSIQKNYQSIPDFMAHNGLMQQVLTNLIKNADQALKEANTSNPTITISASNDDQKIIISIHDNGPGIPEEEKEKIFEPFFTTKTVGEGTGLGLSVTFNIVKKLGGNIIVKSEKNNFTEFTITFPLKAE